MLTVFPTIHYLFQVTLIKKKQNSPGTTFEKLEPLTYSTSQIHLHFGKWAFSSKSSNNDDSNWTVFLYYFSKSLYLLSKIYDLSTHLPRNTLQTTPNIAITTCSDWKGKKTPELAWVFVSSLFRSRFTIYSAESATLPSSLQGNFIHKQSGRKFFKPKEILLSELKMRIEKVRCGNTCSLIKNLARLQIEYMYSHCIWSETISLQHS